MAIRLHVWGNYALFTRPEYKAERVSYDALTPSAARGILDAILWRPAMRWHVDKIHVLRPIRFQSIRRNEVGAKASAAIAQAAMRAGHTNGVGMVVDEQRQQRAAMVLVDIAYVIEAHFELTDKAGPDDTPAKFISMFNRRATQGQCFTRPVLGVREFPADFALLPDGAAMPKSTLPREPERIDLGWMLHDIDFSAGSTPRFFRAEIVNGEIIVPPFEMAEVRP